MTKAEAQAKALSYAQSAVNVKFSLDDGVEKRTYALVSIAFSLVALSGGTTAEHRNDALR